MNIFATKDLIDSVKEKFGNYAHIILFTDGSGDITVLELER